MSMVSPRSYDDVAAASPLVAKTESATNRDAWRAMRRGFMGNCPACGDGKLFSRYLKVNDACPVCHEEMHHQRADDAPPYFTILVVGHVVGAAMLAVEESYDNLPLWLHIAVWPLLSLVLCLTLLPRFKGALIGLQWANRMHGFATAIPVTPKSGSGPAL